MELTTFESRILSVRIHRPFYEGYAFLSIPENFSKWVQGLGTLTEKTGDTWIVASPAASQSAIYRAESIWHSGPLRHSSIRPRGVRSYAGDG